MIQEEAARALSLPWPAAEPTLMTRLNQGFHWIDALRSRLNSLRCSKKYQLRCLFVRQLPVLICWRLTSQAAQALQSTSYFLTTVRGFDERLS